MITNENLSHRRCGWRSDPLRTGADSFKRLLGCAIREFSELNRFQAQNRVVLVAKPHVELLAADLRSWHRPARRPPRPRLTRTLHDGVLREANDGPRSCLNAFYD